jgi:hypothetical protein
MDLVVLGRDAHHLRAAPGDRPHIGVDETVLLQRLGLGRVDLGGAVGRLEIEDARRMAQALGMLGRFEDLAAVGALALEDGAGVVKRVGQNMRLGVAPEDELAVAPDPAVLLGLAGQILILRRRGLNNPTSLAAFPTRSRAICQHC